MVERLAQQRASRSIYTML
ncbi:unnamed protein product, partial [Rotaria magnacalcarata]